MRTQVPKVEGNWLYKNIKDDRWFTKEACLPDFAPDLPECTDSEKISWEESHPEPEPEPEPNEQ